MRDRIQNGSVTLDKRVNIWYFRWSEDGKRKSQVIGRLSEYPTKTKAVRASQQMRDAINATKMVTTPTLGKIVARYRQERMPKRASTAKGYNSWLNVHILPRWEMTPIEEITPAKVGAWLDSLTLSNKSKAEIRSRLGSLFDAAMFWEYMPVARNPMELVKVKDVKRKTTVRILAVEEFHKLREQLADPFRTVVSLAQFHGLSASEVMALKWKDIDWLASCLKVQRSIVLNVEDKTKTVNREAPLPLEEEELEMLRQWRAQSEFTGAEHYIFASPFSAGELPYHYCTYKWKLDQACKRAGIPKIGTHTFRHTYRSVANAAGVTPGMIKDLMRHADIRTSMNVYGAPIDEAMRKAQQTVFQMLSGK